MSESVCEGAIISAGLASVSLPVPGRNSVFTKGGTPGHVRTSAGSCKPERRLFDRLVPMGCQLARGGVCAGGRPFAKGNGPEPGVTTLSASSGSGRCQNVSVDILLSCDSMTLVGFNREVTSPTRFP